MTGLLSLLSRAIAKPNASPRFVFIGAGGDEEADIAVGAMRIAKTFESSPNADLEYHYEIFPGETHGSVGLRAYYSALETLAQPDVRVSYGPARYLTEAQRRRHAWVRRFGSSFATDTLPQFSVARPMLDELSSPDAANLASYWARLKTEYADDFRFDPVERQNLIAYLDAGGRKEDAERLRALPGFGPAEVLGNNYGATTESLFGHGGRSCLCTARRWIFVIRTRCPRFTERCPLPIVTTAPTWPTVSAETVPQSRFPETPITITPVPSA